MLKISLPAPRHGAGRRLQKKKAGAHGPAPDRPYAPHTPREQTHNAERTWKLLADNKANYGISQADMYQMYAYQKKYSAQSTTQNVTLLYPQTDSVSRNNIEFSSDDGIIVRVRFVDLFKIKELNFEEFF